MSMAPQDPEMVHPYHRGRKAKIAYGTDHHGRSRVNVNFPKDLFAQLRKEASEKGWPMSRLIVHLCEASIEGIE